MIFKNDEYIDGPWWLPRRPFVSVPDLFVAGCALYAVLQTGGLVQIYFAVAFAQFFVSFVHHWLPQAAWHHIADRCMIFWLIVLTPVPYLQDIAEGRVVFQVSFWLGIMTATVGTVYLVNTMLKTGRMLSTDCYKLPFAFGVFCLVGVQLTSVGMYAALWIGVLLYAGNGIVIKRYWPTVATARVLQHVGFLYPAFGLHAYVAWSVQ